jgi:NAD/NADP transhydrogenase alpha subunit
MSQKVLFGIFIGFILLCGIGICQSEKTIEHMTVAGGKAWETFSIIAGVIAGIALIAFAVNGGSINKRR